MRTNRGCAVRQAQEAEEELETGEPIPDEDGPPPAKIAAMRGRFGGGAPTQPKPSNSGQGQMVLTTAKYLQRDPEPELRREQEKRAAKEQAAAGQPLEKSIFNSGALGGVVAMMVAVVWFVAGLANDVIFFYPPILFVIGLAAFFKGVMKNE
jgi:hypothetical protein